MPIFKRPAVLLSLSACLLLLLTVLSCRKYEKESFGFEAGGFRNERYDMKPTDELTIRYPLSSSGPIDISELRVQSQEPTITSEFKQYDSAGIQCVKLTLRTSKTPGGLHPLRITIINSNESFIERTATIRVVNFAQLLRDSSRAYRVVDTISETPFKLDTLPVRSQYALRVRQLRSDPPNRFIFSTFGSFKNGNYLQDLVVDIDSVSGEITGQNPAGLENYNGHGWLRYSDNDVLSAYFIYTYKFGPGTGYEGHLSF